MGSKQTREQAEQDVNVFATSSSESETATTTACASSSAEAGEAKQEEESTAKKELITEETFFAQVQTNLTACAELPIITIAEVSACFTTPPASEYEGHAINKFIYFLRDHLLRKFTMPSGGEESLLRTRVTQLSMNSLASNKLMITMKLDPLLLQMPVLLPFSKTYEYEITELSFTYELDVRKYSFKSYRISVKDIAVTGNLVISGDGERQAQSANLFTRYDTSITLAQITVTCTVEPGAPLISTLLQGARVPSNNLNLVLEKTDVESRFCHTVTKLRYSEEQGVWVQLLEAEFVAGYRPSTLAISRNGAVTVLKMKSFQLQQSVLYVRFFVDREEEKGMESSSSYAPYELLASFNSYRSYLVLTTPIFDEITNNVAWQDQRKLSRKLPLLRHLIPKIHRSVIKKLGKLEITSTAKEFVSTLGLLPNFLLDNFAAMFSINIPALQMYGTYDSELTCMMAYHPMAVETDYDFFRMITNLTISPKQSRMNFLILTPLLDFPRPVNAFVQGFNKKSVWSTKSDITHTTIAQILRKGQKFMSPIRNYIEAQWESYQVASVEIQFSPYNETLEFRLSGTSHCHLLFDLRRGEATLKDSKRSSKVVKFTLHRTKLKLVIHERLFNETKLRDICIQLSS